IASALNDPLLLDIVINNTYTTSSRSLTTNISIKFMEEVDRNLKLVVVLTEDGIIAPQKNNNAETGPVPIIFDYVHNHMLRAVINGTWGNEISTSGNPISGTVEKSLTYTLDDKLIPENCTVVAFIYDVDTKEVLQVNQKEL
ncbi:MAG: Omp28-related outer membrane protein, partial [Chloroflexota bacterium]